MGPVVELPGAGRPRGIGVGGFLLALVTVGALAHVAVRMKGIEVAYALGRERRINTELEEQRRRLHIEIGMLKDPVRVVALAHDKLDMGPPADGDIVWLGAGGRLPAAWTGANASAGAPAGNSAKNAAKNADHAAPAARAPASGTRVRTSRPAATAAAPATAATAATAAAPATAAVKPPAGALPAAAAPAPRARPPVFKTPASAASQTPASAAGAHPKSAEAATP
jgi:hypothetical protein